MLEINGIVFLSTMAMIGLAEARSAVCGRKLYDTEIDICCDGAVIHGGALGRWGCCGKAPLAMSRELCCNGTIQFVYNVETTDKHCCGSDLLDPAEGICCHNQTFLGHTWCPGSFYGGMWLLLAGVAVVPCTVSVLLCVWKKTKGSSNYKTI